MRAISFALTDKAGNHSLLVNGFFYTCSGERIANYLPEERFVVSAPKNLKEWKSYSEQVDILQKHGLIIEDKAAAEKVLAVVGYYRLGGYPFRVPDENASKEAVSGRLGTFQKGSRFTDIVALYRFDRALRLLVFEAIEIIEPAMQTRIAYHLGQLHPSAHERKQFWDKNFLRKDKKDKNDKSKSKYDEWQEKYQSLLKRSKKLTFVEHNLEKYGCLPIWVAIEIFDFGTLSKLYAGLTDRDRLKIAQPFGIDGDKTMTSWLRGLNFIRNKAAHHMRLWNCNILDPASVPSALSRLKRLDNTRPFLYFCLIQRLLKQIGTVGDKWGEKFKRILDDFPEPENKAVSLKGMGVVEGWREWDLWK